MLQANKWVTAHGEIAMAGAARFAKYLIVGSKKSIQAGWISSVITAPVIDEMDGTGFEGWLWCSRIAALCAGDETGEYISKPRKFLAEMRTELR